MKISEISEGLKSIIKNTANKLSGAERREYIGEIATELLNGNPRKAEGVFGWGRETVKTYGVILVSSQPYNVVKYISYVPHIQLEGIKHEEIHRDAY